MAKVRVKLWLLVLSSILLAAMGIIGGCKSVANSGFRIVLDDTGEVVITDEHISSYDWQTHTIELTDKGKELWNSFHTFGSIPKLTESLFNREFVATLDGKELYRGKFYSGLSSMSYSGVVILDAMFTLDDKYNKITIDYGYPLEGFGAGEDPRNNPELYKFLETKGLLK